LAQLPPGQARLVGLTELVAGRTWPIPLGRSRLGRGSQCEIRIEHANLAEIHAEVVARPEHTVITALQSDAGLVLNGQPLRIGDLGDGDTLEIVGLQFRFQQAKARPPQSIFNWKQLTIVVLAMVILAAVALAFW
jgi:pSer/pThr/pTyr-binding forkhead associated (FHA) protein